MLRFLMRCGRVHRPVSFHQDKPGRVILLLDYIKPSDPGFLEACDRIGSGRLLERLNVFWLHPHLDMNN